MGNRVGIALHTPSSTAIHATPSRRKKIWILFGIIVGIIIITTIVLATTIGKTSGSTTSTTITTSSTPKDRTVSSSKPPCLVNAWIHLSDDQPNDTNYNSPNSSFQRLIQKNIYQSVNILFIAGVSIIAIGHGDTYTIDIDFGVHPGGLSNQDYMNNVIRDARQNNPNIKIVVGLYWSTSMAISQIFSHPHFEEHVAAQHFASNLMVYLKKHDLDGFDIGWQLFVSRHTTTEQFAFLINAIGTEFKNQTDKHYYLTLSPAEVGNLDAQSINNHMDFISFQLYSRYTFPNSFKHHKVNPQLFAYGAKFESGYQTAAQAYQDNKNNYRFNIFTCWRLNSKNYLFEQTQQQALFKLCNKPHF